jgi:hypothetical protein
VVYHLGLGNVHFHEGQERFEEVAAGYWNHSLCLVAFNIGLEQDGVCLLVSFVVVVTGF